MILQKNAWDSIKMDKEGKEKKLSMGFLSVLSPLIMIRG